MPKEEKTLRSNLVRTSGNLKGDLNKASADLKGLPVNDKNIIRIVGEDKKILGTIERHGKALEKSAKEFDGVVRAIKKYDEKNGADRRRREAAAAALKKARKHRVKTGNALKRALYKLKGAAKYHQSQMRRQNNAAAAHKKAQADHKRHSTEHAMLRRTIVSSAKETTALKIKVEDAEKALKECREKPAKKGKDPWDFDWGSGFDFNWA